MGWHGDFKVNKAACQPPARKGLGEARLRIEAVSRLKCYIYILSCAASLIPHNDEVQ